MLVFKARPRKSPNLADELTSSQRRIIQMLTRAMERVQDSINLRELEDLIEHRSADEIASRITVDPWVDMQEDLAEELYGELRDAGRRVKLPNIQKATLTYRFDADRPEARLWARKEAGNLIVEVIDDQREVVRGIVARSQAGEATVAQVARQVRGSIGLTERQAGWVENFRQRRIDEATARGIPAERAAASVQGDVDRYHRRIHRYRSETIARTETLRSSSEGRQQAWQQGLDEGFISPFAQKKWLAEFDACDICTPMGAMDPIPINETFPVGEPPAHPNCRCDVLLVDEPAELELTDEELDARINELMDQPVPTPPSLPGIGAVREGDLYEALPNQDAWLGALSGAQRQALRDYTGKSGDLSADELNTAMRRGSLTAEQRERASHIQDAIDEAERMKVTPQTPLYRGQQLELTGPQVGLTDDVIRERIYERTQELYPIDSEIDLGRGAFISTSTDVAPALDASLSRNSPGIVFEIAPTPGAPMQALTRYDDEYEVLLSQTKRFKVVGIQKDETFIDAGLQERPRTVVQLLPLD